MVQQRLKAPVVSPVRCRFKAADIGASDRRRGTRKVFTPSLPGYEMSFGGGESLIPMLHELLQRLALTVFVSRLLPWLTEADSTCWLMFSARTLENCLTNLTVECRARRFRDVKYHQGFSNMMTLVERCTWLCPSPVSPRNCRSSGGRFRGAGQDRRKDTLATW